MIPFTKKNRYLVKIIDLFKRNTNKAEAAKEKKSFMKEFYRTTDTLELDKNYKVRFYSQTIIFH